MERARQCTVSQTGVEKENSVQSEENGEEKDKGKENTVTQRRKGGIEEND